MRKEIPKNLRKEIPKNLALIGFESKFKFSLISKNEQKMSIENTKTQSEKILVWTYLSIVEDIMRSFV